MIGDKGGNCWQRLPIKARHCQPPRSSTLLPTFPPISSLFFAPSRYNSPFSLYFSFFLFSFPCRLLPFLTPSIHLSFYCGLSLPFNLHLPHDHPLPSFYQATRALPRYHGEILILRGAIARSSESLINDSVFIIKPRRSTIYFWITFYLRGYYYAPDYSAACSSTVQLIQRFLNFNFDLEVHPSALEEIQFSFLPRKFTFYRRVKYFVSSSRYFPAIKVRASRKKNGEQGRLNFPEERVMHI